MSQRKDTYRAAMQRPPAEPPPSAGGFVIRTKPVSLTIDVDPGLRRAIAGLTPTGVVRGAARQVARVWPSRGSRTSKPAQGS